MPNQNKIIANKAQPLGHYPHLKQVGDWLFISGTSSRRSDNTHVGATRDKDGNWRLDIRAQTRAVIENIEESLKSVGADLSHLVNITTFLVNMRDFEGYNAVYGEFFNHATGPARTTVAVRELPHPNLLIEIQATAYVAQD